MIHLLDSNVLVALLNGHVEARNRLDALHPEDVILCAPVLAELEYGACFSTRKQDNLARIRALAARMRFQAFDEAAAHRFGSLKADLRRLGTLKTDFDLAIAVIALDFGATLVSDDRAFHDGSIPDLKVENWLMS